MKPALFNARRSRSRRRNGQALVEFAFALVMFLVILCGIIEFGLYGQNLLKLANSTREGARAAAVGKPLNTIRATVAKFASPLSVANAEGEVKIEVSSDRGATYSVLTDTDDGTHNAALADQYVRITSTATNSSITGLFGPVFHRRFSQQVVMRRENAN